MGGGAFYRAEPLGYGGACSNDGGGLAAAAFPHAGLAIRPLSYVRQLAHTDEVAECRLVWVVNN